LKTQEHPASSASFFLINGPQTRKEIRAAMTLDEWIRSAKSSLKTIILAMLLGGWTIGWGVILLIGWATSSAAVMGTSFAAIALSAFATGGWRYTVVRRRRLLARRSLKARLQLRGIRLAGEIAALVELFDLVSRDVEAGLARPELAGGLFDSIPATLDTA